MFELWKLKRAQRKNGKVYRKTLKAFQTDKTKTLEEFNSFLSGNVFEENDIDEQISLFLSGRLIDEAKDHDVALPEREQDSKVWQHSEDGEHVFLNAGGRSELRKLVDAEKSRRFEVKTLWVTKILLPLAGILVGIIGAATGFIAVWRHGK